MKGDKRNKRGKGREWIIFEQDGVYNWPLCSKKLGLARQVAEIKQL